MLLRRLFLMALLLLPLVSCYYIGCYSLKDACYDCCKQELKPFAKLWGGKQAYDAREPCTEECIKFARENGKDGYWVERHKACMLGTVNYRNK